MGKLFLGATCFMAFIDGGLTALIVATVVGAASYGVVKSNLNGASTQICDAAEEALQAKVDAIKDSDLRKQAQEAMAKKMKEIRKRREEDNWGAEEVSKLVALGIFAFPPAAIGVAAHLLTKE